jgi:hypothetical protein
MKMKKAILFLCLSMFAASAMAQFLGLPIADSAQAPATGETSVSAGAVMGDDFNLYGGRLSFAPVRPLAVFADLGAIDPDGGDTGLAFQLGGKFTLPLKESPVDVALRAVWDWASFDLKAGDVTSTGFNAGVLVSREVNLISPYAYAGLNFVDSEIKVKGGGKNSDDSTDLALAIGTLIRLSEQISLYVEFAHVDDAFIGFGARWGF